MKATPFQRLAVIYQAYPHQFWLVAFGLLLSSAGSSIIWPFQLIYISQTLDLPLSSAATLITISSVTGMLVSTLGGSIADQSGRKPLMVLALLVNGLGFILMSQARTYVGFLLPITLMGAANPFYAIGSDAMMADLLPSAKRPEGYSILRMINNAGIAIGPAIGGFLVTQSYQIAFYSAAASVVIYSLMLAAFGRETLVRSGQAGTPAPSTHTGRQGAAGYGRVLADRAFIGFTAVVTIGMIAPLMMWTLLAVYTKTQYDLPEYLYSWLPVTNALMCVFVQFFVTRLTRVREPMRMVALGMLVYALGVGSVAVMRSFPGFWVSMVIITFGELILIPTASTYVANRAPEDLRGRYMSTYWLTWGMARAVAPVLGGFLNDQIAPQAIWWGGLALGLFSTAILALMARRAAPLAGGETSQILP